jgi:hypothetical protein
MPVRRVFANKMEGFSTAILKIFNFSAKTGAYLLHADLYMDFRGKNVKKQLVIFCIIIRQNPTIPHFLDLFSCREGVFLKVIHRGCGHAGIIFWQGV